jgi:polyribonucleotide nucleotidyltransferase
MPDASSVSLGAKTLSVDYAGQPLTIEYGKIAKLADGAAVVRLGETVILATAVVGGAREGGDFFPLTVDYEERLYAAGKISGSRFIKREGRPSENAILTARLIDRPIRPLFPGDCRNEIQLIVTVLSIDMVNDPDVLAVIAASAALTLAGAPFEGPVGAARVGLVDGKLKANPSYEELAQSELDLVVAGTKDAILMVEAGASEVPREQMVEAIKLAHDAFIPGVELQEKLRADARPQKDIILDRIDDAIVETISDLVGTDLDKLVRAPQGKTDRDASVKALFEQVKGKLGERHDALHLYNAFDTLYKKAVRGAILKDNLRPDGRKPAEIRPITSEVGVLPRTHGSALFTRGETQALTTATLGPTSDAQLIDTMEEDTSKRYMHHYNFLPYSTGETGRVGSPKRREIGHGALAERALFSVLPPVEEFPYTIRLVSEIVASNGSTSMAATCGSTLALMDAGVPISSPVSGIAMGLVTDGKKSVVLSDIQGAEDFAGDMDFKVAGTRKGITALQMDIKVKGLSLELMAKALEQADAGREHILKEMEKALRQPRSELSPFAPRITTIHINPEKIRDVIGKGGEMINKIIAETGVDIDIQDDGAIFIASPSGERSEAAIEWIKRLTVEPEVGGTYRGKVVRVMDFGAFVEIMPGRDGLVHISQWAPERIEKMSDVAKVGDDVTVKLVEIDSQGRLNLSRKAVKQD